MRIRFIGKYDEDRENGYISFWTGRIRYKFEIIYKDDDEENIEFFEDELKLNLENQLGLEIIHKE